MSPMRTCAPPRARLGLSLRDEAERAVDEEISVIELAPTRAAQIIVADDDSEMRSLLVQALEADGHEIVEAKNGAELLERLDFFWSRGREPDLVISDVRMPGLSGLQVLDLMNDEDRFAPVVMVTAFGDHSVHERAATLGAITTLDKPFDVHELRELARRILRSVQP